MESACLKLLLLLRNSKKHFRARESPSQAPPSTKTSVRSSRSSGELGIPASLVSSLSARSQLPVCPRLPTPYSPLPLSLARASCVPTPAPTQQQDFHRLSIMGVIDTPAVKKTTMVKMFIALALVAMAVLFVVSTLPRREEGEGAIEHAFEEVEEL